MVNLISNHENDRDAIDFAKLIFDSNHRGVKRYNNTNTKVRERTKQVNVPTIYARVDS